MALRKCPRCELNYIKGDAELCDVCMRESKRIAARNHAADEDEPDEILMCSECGEAPAVHGSELCAECLREQKRQAELESAALLDAELDEALSAEEGDDAEADEDA